jgi:FMN phosphatase YigB (HAD superfamily)
MGITGESLKAVETACDTFYTTEFNTVKSIVRHSEIPTRLVREMAKRGYCVVLATNPLFPPCAVDSRLDWLGLSRNDFSLITHYENSTFCKPNLDYYREVFSKINKSPEQCIMVGNNPAEDMCAGQLGTETYLVTDFTENEAEVDISEFRKGSLKELEVYLMSFPSLK